MIILESYRAGVAKFYDRERWSLLINSEKKVQLVRVDAYELRRLARRFKKLDLDGSGSLSVDEFMSLPELQQNPLVQRVIDIFDEDGDGEVDFRVAFRIYDMDRDGYISNGELFQVLKMMVGNNLKDNQLQQIVDKTILFHDKDGDGFVSIFYCRKMLDEISLVCEDYQGCGTHRSSQENGTRKYLIRILPVRQQQCSYFVVAKRKQISQI
ncbi:unnamed protein product [Litomosoides sigmodontis]|uniref:EF-hand domain-containing protein n=1 Tax=Litomosoides sigmodontis TaxID=42156 RepID=A0A3P6SR03_LITSI|nr:unnamed protein product [Litomosoides sigmodontis]